ncbi:MAG: DEAD/DEAH box helicase family protein [Taibaiella sp.]|nr:DEAD/DEAH box helicase family protein [Taibaiella sp.]
MLPNPLLKHIYNNASDDVIRRGKKIFHTSGASLVEHDLLTEKVVFRVRNDVYETNYRVVINNFIHTDKLNTRCLCPYNMGIVCKHEAAALLQLNELLQSGYFEQINITYDQAHTLLRMRHISDQHLKMFTSEDIRREARKILTGKGSVKVLLAADDKVVADIKDKGKVFQVTLAQNEERYFDTICSCEESRHPMCAHKLALFEMLLEEHGANYFSTLRNWDKEKNKLLALYGFSLEDDLKGKFEFAFIDGKLTMRVMNAGIKKLTDPQHPSNKLKKEQEEEIGENQQLILVIRKEEDFYPHFGAVVATCGFSNDQPKGMLSYPSLLQIQNYIGFSDEQKNIAVAVSKISKQELLKAIKRDMPFGEFVSNLEGDLRKEPGAELSAQVWDYYWPKFSKLFELHKDFDKAFITRDWNQPELKTSGLMPVRFSEHKFKLRLYVTAAGTGTKKEYHIQAQLLLNEIILNQQHTDMLADGIMLYDGALYASENSNIPVLLRQYPLDRPKAVSADDWNDYLENSLLKLDNRVIIAFHKSLQKEISNVEPRIKLEITEYDQKYIFVPIFDYDGISKKWLDASPAIASDKGKVITYQRNEASENTFLNTLKYLHPNMQERRKLQGFVLPVKDALKKGWYFDFIDLMKSKDVELQGFEQLKQSRINPNKPVANIQFSTGIDWFSAKAEVFFGDQSVSLADLKKVISKSENTIKLKDGSQGLITEDFLEQYGLMFKMGKIDGDEIRISKIHFSTIEHLEEVRENAMVFDEIEEKKRRLVNYDFDSKLIAIPHNLNADLRPYQKSGFHWMGFLKETGWGGILADDMGLGKTVQTLSILVSSYNDHPEAKFLVVCPTSLIYNWENECKKFTPDIVYHIYHGPNRKKDHQEFNKANLIITTYGTLRSDIELLGRMEWEYVILDESQAIKNPLSQASKASLKLEAKKPSGA